MNKFYKKLRNLGLAFLVAGSFANYTSAQFGCATGVAITNGYTATAITTPGTGGAEDWNINPPGPGLPGYWWDDDVYLFEYTAGALAEEITMTIFTRKTWTSIGIFGSCTGTQFSNELNAVGDFAGNVAKTATAVIAPNQTVFIAVGQYGSPNDLDFDVTNFSTTVITCPDPINLLSSAINATGATVDWTENGTATTWNIEWGLSGYTPGTIATVGSDMGNTSQTSVITGLNPATTYDAYVQSDCGGGDLSSWVGPLTFTTACLTEVAPWSEDFENGGIIPNCWNQGASNGEAWKFANTGGFNHIGSNGTLNGATTSGGYFAWVDDSSPSSIGTSLLSPFVDVSGLTSPMLRFFLISDNEGQTNVNFSVDIWDGANWNIGMYTSNSNTANNAWQEIDVYMNTLTITGDIQLRFVVDEINGGDFYDDVAIDDVEVREAPTCLKPTNLVATNITSSGADLGWTENNGSTSWNIEYGVAGFTPGSGTQPPTINTNPYSVTMLANTTYEFYVQTDCGGGDLSDWAGPFTYSNAYCDYTVTSTAPQHVNSFITNGAVVDINNPASGPGTTNSGYSDFSSTLTMDAYETQIIDFSMEGSNTSTLWSVSIYIDWNNDFVFDASENVYAPGGYVGMPHNNSLAIPAGTPIGQYRMRVIGGYFTTTLSPCSASNGEAEDYTINIITPPTCLPVMDIDTVNVSTTSVELSWTELNTATSWEIEYGLSGFAQGTGMTATATSNPFTVVGLNPSVEYDFYIQADCGGGDLAAWRGPFSMYTDCGIAVAPYYEGFNNAMQPQCWENLTSGTGTSANNFWKFTGAPGYGATPNGRPVGTYAWTDGSTPNPDSIMLVTPVIDISQLTTPYLSFEWFSNNTQNPLDNTPLIIEVFDGTSWTYLDTLIADSVDWMFVNYDLSSFLGNNIQIRFMINQNTTTAAAFYSDILLDDVRVDDCISLGGQDGMFDVCRLDSTVNLEGNIIVKPNGGGIWSFPGQPAYVVDDTVFNVQFLPAGAYEVYYVERYVCYDTTTATINVFGPSSAGIDGTINVCKNEPVNLYGVLGGNVDIGGVWYDFTNSALPNSQPKAEPIPGQYNYTYVVTNGVCPADTSIVEVGVLDSCDFLAIGEELFTDISVYPNPTMNILNIVNPSNTSSLKLEMFDMNGRLVLVENKALSNATEATIAIDHLEKGIYTLRVYNDNGQKTFKIVKQ
jgi:hypothetical protein